MDNHQEELAEELAIQGYVVHGHLEYTVSILYTGQLLTWLSDLPAALGRSESLRNTQSPWPPADTGEDPAGKGLIGVMDDELGFVD